MTAFLGQLFAISRSPSWLTMECLGQASGSAGGSELSTLFYHGV